jgi:hypothetical protein
VLLWIAEDLEVAVSVVLEPAHDSPSGGEIERLRDLRDPVLRVVRDRRPVPRGVDDVRQPHLGVVDELGRRIGGLPRAR